MTQSIWDILWTVLASIALFGGTVALVFVAVPTAGDLIGDWRHRRADRRDNPARHRSGDPR